MTPWTRKPAPCGADILPKEQIANAAVALTVDGNDVLHAELASRVWELQVLRAAAEASCITMRGTKDEIGGERLQAADMRCSPCRWG